MTKPMMDLRALVEKSDDTDLLRGMITFATGRLTELKVSGVTTSIMARADALGNLIDFRLPPGKAQDLRGAAALIEGLARGQFLVRCGFDANRVKEALIDVRIKTGSC